MAVATLRPEIVTLIDQIKDQPTDDTPRLVLADWLQEHGNAEQAARGELIRLQVLRHQLVESDPRQPSLRRRESELLSRHIDDWVGPLMDHFTWRFERGLLHLEGRAGKLLALEVGAIATLERCVWVEALTLRDVRRNELAGLATSPFLPHVNALDLCGNQLQSNRLVPLLRSPNLGRLRLLLLGGNRLSLAGTRTVANNASLAGLMHLDLAGNRLSDECGHQLARAPHLERLERLDLRGNRLGAEVRAALLRRFSNRVVLDAARGY